MKKENNRAIPEIRVSVPPRRGAGFVPARQYSEPDEELWQLWCRKDAGTEVRETRLTYSEAKRFGLRRR